MTAICTRIIFMAEGQPDPLDPTNPQLLFVRERAGVNLDPVLVRQGAAPLEGTVSFWDALIDEHFDKTGYVILYEAEMQSVGGEIVVKRDQFGKGEYPYIWSGWPTPGDEDRPPDEDPAPLKLTEAQQEALSRAYGKRKGDAAKTTYVSEKVSNWDAEIPAKKLTGRK